MLRLFHQHPTMYRLSAKIEQTLSQQARIMLSKCTRVTQPVDREGWEQALHPQFSSVPTLWWDFEQSYGGTRIEMHTEGRILMELGCFQNQAVIVRKVGDKLLIRCGWYERWFGSQKLSQECYLDEQGEVYYHSSIYEDDFIPIASSWEKIIELEACFRRDWFRWLIHQRRFVLPDHDRNAVHVLTQVRFHFQRLTEASDHYNTMWRSAKDTHCLQTPYRAPYHCQSILVAGHHEECRELIEKFADIERSYGLPANKESFSFQARKG
jgi:hypothetical protein